MQYVRKSHEQVYVFNMCTTSLFLHRNTAAVASTVMVPNPSLEHIAISKRPRTCHISNIQAIMYTNKICNILQRCSTFA